MDEEAEEKPRSLEERFWVKVDIRGKDECWNWKASQDGNGYGHFEYKYKPIKAYRFAYELLIGKIPKDKELDHLCRNTLCVNPYHLEPVTHRENMLRGNGFPSKEARQTHCKRGHEFNEENTYHDRRGSRECRVCAREWDRKRRIDNPNRVKEWLTKHPNYHREHRLKMKRLNNNE